MYYSGIKETGYNLEEKSIVSKGEGSIYSVNGRPELLAKIYHKKSGDLSFTSAQNRREKLLNMIQTASSRELQYLAWPIDVLLNSEKEVCGFIMKRFQNMTAVSMILPAESNADWKKRIIIAHNLCDVVQEVHGMNQVIGDMNPDNYGVDLTGSLHVCGFDVDSFHYRDQYNHLYPCYVGLAPYYAPELQVQIARGEDMRTLNPEYTFSKETDRFALAVLIFQLLFMGYHPFTGARAAGYGSSTVVRKSETNILNGISPYFNPTSGMTPPRTAPPLDIVPENMKKLFQAAFLEAPEKRPTASCWQEELSALLKSITSCRKGHCYTNERSECPWCKKIEIQAQTTPPPKPIPTPSPKPIPNPPPIKHCIIPIIYCDRDGNRLQSSTINVEYGKRAYATAIQIPGYHLIGSRSRIEISVDHNGTANPKSVRFAYEKNEKKKKGLLGKTLRVWLCLGIGVAILYHLMLYANIQSNIRERNYEEAYRNMLVFPLYKELFPTEFNNVKHEVTKINKQKYDNALKERISLPYGIRPEMSLSEADKKMKQAGFVGVYSYENSPAILYGIDYIPGWYAPEAVELRKEKEYMYVELEFSKRTIAYDQNTLSEAYRKIRSDLIEDYGQPSGKSSDGYEYWSSRNSKNMIWIIQTEYSVYVYYYYYY